MMTEKERIAERQKAYLESRFFYRPSDEANVTRRRAQLEYFWVICAYDEQAHYELFTELKDLYFFARKSLTVPTVDWALYLLEEAPASMLSEAEAQDLQELVDALFTWRHTSHFQAVDPDCAWVLDLALHLLDDLWAKREFRERQLGFYWVALRSGGGWDEPEPQEQLNFQLVEHSEFECITRELLDRDAYDELEHYTSSVVRPYNPSRESRDDARTRIIKAFEKKLDLYLDSVEEKISKDGYVPMKMKRARKGPRNIHFHWLYFHQVYGLTSRQIADGMADDSIVVTEAAVSKALKETAELIG